MSIKSEKNGQLKFDFSKDVQPKSHQDYEFEAAKYQAEHVRKPQKPTSFEDVNSDNRDLLTDEEYSDMMLAAQDHLEDLREQWAEEARNYENQMGGSGKNDDDDQDDDDDDDDDDGPDPDDKSDKKSKKDTPNTNKVVTGPKNDGHLPSGYTNTFPRDEMGNMYDDGFSFDEKE